MFCRKGGGVHSFLLLWVLSMRDGGANGAVSEKDTIRKQKVSIKFQKYFVLLNLLGRKGLWYKVLLHCTATNIGM